MDDIQVDINPSHETLSRIESRYPLNPFYTVSYVKSVETQGAQTIMFAAGSGDDAVEYCLAHLYCGRVSKSMVVYSLTDISRSESFWRTLNRFLDEQRIYYAQIGSFASSGSIMIPEQVKKNSRTIRTEYIVDLKEADLWQQVSKHHRRHIKKALKAGVIIENSGRKEDGNTAAVGHLHGSEEVCLNHKRLMDASMARRKAANKSYIDEVDNTLCIPFIESGAGKIYRAVLEGNVIASSMILRSDGAGYYHSSGNSVAAAKTGASHLLIYTVMEELKAQGRMVFNLGGGNNEAEGLDRFKQGFGARHIGLVSAEMSRQPLAFKILSKLYEMKAKFA